MNKTEKILFGLKVFSIVMTITKQLDDELSQIIAERTSITYKKTPRLQNMKKENFFTNNVNYTYDHDTIHAAVKMLTGLHTHITCKMEQK